jgi:deoxyribose-phosphate aldolase
MPQMQASSGFAAVFSKCLNGLATPVRLQFCGAHPTISQKTWVKKCNAFLLHKTSPMRLNAFIDHTVLKPTTLIFDVEKLCTEAMQHRFAAVCVPPPFVKLAAGLLKETGIKTATVIGFPFGYSATEAKLAELVLAIVDGADEMDMVQNIAAVKNNDWAYLDNEIALVMQVVTNKNKLLKVILETGLLTDQEIVACCKLYEKHKVHFVKTSTGYAEKGATVEAVALMRQSLPEEILIKASGGIKNYAFAKLLMDAGAARLGCSASVAIVGDPLNQ